MESFKKKINPEKERKRGWWNKEQAGKVGNKEHGGRFNPKYIDNHVKCKWSKHTKKKFAKVN